MSDLLLRLALSDDLPRIVEIYNAAIPGRKATADLTPVSVADRVPWFHAHTPDCHPLIVADEGGGEIVGWASLSPFYGRPAYRHTAEISVYVAPQHSGRGIGRTLVDEMLRRCPELGIKTVLAVIFAHNEPSVRLFTSRGFKLWGHLPRIAELDGVERDAQYYGLRVERAM
ncbi:MAG TPA: GNAT family N-acetyltransferase [Planctomycetota bacterium]|jgi:phosphinothricin acetyltransferase